MKRFALVLACVCSIATAQARDTEYHLKIADVLNRADFQEKLGHDVAFYFGDQPAPQPARTFGTFTSNRKTDSVGRPDQEACRWAMLSALLAFKKTAEKLGGNAVINIVSYYKKNAASSDTDYECHAGNFVAGVALRGTIIKTN